MVAEQRCVLCPCSVVSEVRRVSSVAAAQVAPELIRLGKIVRRGPREAWAANAATGRDFLTLIGCEIKVAAHDVASGDKRREPVRVASWITLLSL